MKRQTTILPFLPFIMLLLLSSCGHFLKLNKDKSNHNYPFSSIHFEQLRCINLSENVSRLSSQNDEILLLLYLHNDQGKMLQQYQSNYIEFLETNKSHEIGQQFHLPSSNIQYTLTIILIEQDTDRPISTLSQLVEANLDQSQEQLTTLLLDDDLLGVKQITINTTKNTRNNEVKFWGINLFDEYEYLLTFRLE